MNIFAECAENLDLLEYNVSVLPDIAMEEVDLIVSRFAEREAAQVDKDATPDV